MKKRPLTTSFDDLMKNHYGGARADARHDISGSAKKLFARYYGDAAGACGKNGRAKPSTALSLSHDDGETLSQNGAGEEFEEYVVQQSVADDGFEEYVVEAKSLPEGYAVGRSYLSFESSAGERLAAIPSDEANPTQECEVDIFPPPKKSNIPVAKVTTANNYPDDSARPRERPADGGQSSPPNYGASQSKNTDDDFMADMQSILSGQMVYDPSQGKTVKRDELGQAPPSPDQDRRRDEPPAPDAKNTQAIFDRIAQSMQYANAYDLGTVELENRFANFDNIAEREERSAREKKAKLRPKTPSTHVPSVPSAATPAAAAAAADAAAVDSADFIRDLDAIKQKVAGSYGPRSAPVTLSLSLEGVGLLGAPDTGCMPLALSLSSTDNPADYSRPLYDTGEHVRAGWDLYTDQLHVGKTPGVLFSYGQLISMADLYKTVNDMMGADPTELQKLKTLIQQSTDHYTGKGARDIKDDQWEKVTNKRYLELAEDNFHHFSPDYLFGQTAWGKNGGLKPNNKSTWERYHRLAIEEAQKIFLAPENANRSFLPEWPLIINAFGDHFLTDAFASGHLVNKEAIIEYYKYNFYDGNSLKPEAKKFFERVAALAWRDEVKTKFSVLETVEGKIPLIGTVPVVDWGHPNIDSAGRFASLLQSIAEQKPDQIGNLAVKALHDKLNKEGIEVVNDAGDGPWKLYGDGMLDNDSLKIIQKAVQQSVDNINDPSINGSNLNFQVYFDKVWKYVPKLTPASEQKVKLLAKEYTSPTSGLLTEAAADLIYEKCDILIEKLTAAKKLRHE